MPDHLGDLLPYSVEGIDGQIGKTKEFLRNSGLIPSSTTPGWNSEFSRKPGMNSTHSKCEAYQISKGSLPAGVRVKAGWSSWTPIQLLLCGPASLRSLCLAEDHPNQ